MSLTNYYYTKNKSFGGNCNNNNSNIKCKIGNKKFKIKEKYETNYLKRLE